MPHRLPPRTPVGEGARVTRTQVRTAAMVAGPLAVLLRLAGGWTSLRQHTPVRGAAHATWVTPRAAAPSPPPGPRTLTVLGAGDVLLPPPVWEQAAADARAQGRSRYDFDPLFAAVRP